MPDMTALQVITAAFRKNGILSPSSEQQADGLQDLQNMLSSWSAEGLTVPYYTTENFTLTIGQAVYTIGSGGDLDTVRPLKLTQAFIRISNDDYPVDVHMTRKAYSEILSKDLEGRPRRLYYDPQYPLGKIKFEYEADVAYDFHLVSEKPLTNPAATTTTFSIPLEANEAMIYNLAIRLAIDNDNQLPQEVFVIAQTSKRVLEEINAIDKLSDHVTLDPAVTYNLQHSTMDITAGE